MFSIQRWPCFGSLCRTRTCSETQTSLARPLIQSNAWKQVSVINLKQFCEHRVTRWPPGTRYTEVLGFNENAGKFNELNQMKMNVLIDKYHNTFSSVLTASNYIEYFQMNCLFNCCCWHEYVWSSLSIPLNFVCLCKSSSKWGGTDVTTSCLLFVPVLPFIFLNCFLEGYRSIQLKNEYSEELELASLFVHVLMQNPKVRESERWLSWNYGFVKKKKLVDLNGCSQCQLLAAWLCVKQMVIHWLKTESV